MQFQTQVKRRTANKKLLTYRLSIALLRGHDFANIKHYTEKKRISLGLAYSVL